jgi:hypothetical protein
MANSISGRLAAVKLGTDIIRGLGKWDLDITTKENDDTEFGSGWESTNVGMLGWKCSFSGHVNATDAQQALLVDYLESGALIQNIRLYVNDTIYYAPDLATDADAGGRVTSYKVSQSKDGIATLDINLAGSGPITRHS